MTAFDDDLRLAHAIADQVDSVTMDRFRALDLHVETKPDHTPVTDADRAAEATIRQHLGRARGRDAFLGEESGSHGHGPRQWVVDPIDGTKNFVHGSPDFAVMLSELHHGEVVRAWILHPAHEAFYIAERGAGVERDGRALPPTTTPHHLTVVTSSPRLEGTHGSLDLGPTAWSCGIDYPWLLEGRVHGLLYTRGLPWDHCPGSLMVRELGGVVAHLDGTPYDVGADRGRIGLLAASSQEAWDRIAPEVAHLYRG